MLTLTLDDRIFREFREYIYDKCGIFIADNKKYLIENRLSRIIQEKRLDSYEAYLNLLRVSTNGNELTRLFDAVTTNETYFFREFQQIELFVEQLIPNIMKHKNGTGKLKIWSAACSTGEEPYTVAMMMMEKFISPDRFEIHASDLSESVLASAKSGVFNSYSVRNISEAYMNKYFVSTGQSFSLKDTVRNKVAFRKANLINNMDMRALRGMDVIFCRNVLIYFDLKAKQKVISNLYDSLTPGGYLFIGASESLHNITRAFKPCIINRVVAYQKV